ncbi:hypothetical protein POM88_000771 [Heracleum sosnowskyi]|uniref:F-box associated beta-propeller type 1 domain-containing protein n=1 Tax=Heracleum sosnowskyi TaxID=360622 RepID=A0AAD8JCG7_9APIA|nr:hypothetical protein POM88_000771 [Heracleum sosnowskyi]
MADPYSDNLIAYDRWSDDQLSVVNTNFLDKGVSYLDFPSNPKSCNVVGSCNGLICVAYKQNIGKPERLYLWNPATREVKHVHEYKINIFSNYYDVLFGFCFDISSGDYKAVRIVIEHRLASVMAIRFEVYSLIKNNWKEIKVNRILPGNETSFGRVLTVVESKCPAIVKGAIYWKIKHVVDYHSRFALLSFDVKSENLCTISLPDSIMCRRYSWEISLFEFKESVAVIDEKGQNEDISIWTLDDDRCWIMKFTITMRPSPFKIVGCLVGKYRVDDQLLLYNPVNNVVKQTQLKIANPRVYSFSESLVNLSLLKQEYAR